MSKKKLLRYEQFGDLPNSFQAPDYMNPDLFNHLEQKVDMKGRWHEYFGNQQPITLELGCGRAEYTVALAQRYPHRNFVAVDIKGNRMYVGASQAQQQGLKNAAFVRTPIECLEHFFAPGEVSEIWITFADPQPGKPRKRLTSPLFLERYRRFLAQPHIMHLKTDSAILYESTIEVLAEEKGTILYQNANIYAGPLAYPDLDCKTHYEQIHSKLGKTIKYLRFSL